MILLDKSSYDLLDYLLKLDKPETVMTISKAIGQSRRKIYYHLEKINDALPAGLPAIVGIPRIGIVLSLEQKAACRDLLAEIDDYSYVMSIEERIQLSLTYIAVAEERVTIEKLMRLNDVSRNTVLNDLHEIRNHLALEQYNIQLGVTKSRGYYMDGHPLSKIQYLYRLLYQVYHEGSSNFIALLEDKIARTTDIRKHFHSEILTYLNQEVRGIQKKLGKKINRHDIQFMLKVLPYLLMSYRSIPLTEEERLAISQDFIPAQERKEYLIAKELAQGLLTAFDLKLDENEMSIIAILLLSYRKDSDSHVFSHDFDSLRQTLDRFISNLEEDGGLVFVRRQELSSQLMMHCKALLFRKTYGILSQNPLTREIKDKYSGLFGLVKKASSILEEDWLISLTDDELAYLTIHIGGELQHASDSDSPVRLVLICDEGVGLQKLLLKQCLHYLPDSQIEAVFTTEQFYSVADILQADLLVSTNDSLDTELPVLLVSPLLTDGDIINLVRFIRYKGRAASRFDVRLEELISRYVRDKKEAGLLKSQIEEILKQDLLNDFNLID